MTVREEAHLEINRKIIPNEFDYAGRETKLRRNLIPGSPMLKWMDLVQATPVLPHGIFSVVMTNLLGLSLVDWART